MRLSTLKFLRSEMDALQQEAELMRAGLYRVVRVEGDTPIDMTAWCVERLERRILRFEQAIASLDQ